MNIDVIVTTYNRPEKLEGLVKELTEILPNEGKIIVVDSSDLENLQVQKMDRVFYLRSSHKNQPYQRLLGAKASGAEIILFLDDDLNIIRKDIFQLIMNTFLDNSVVGVSVAFEYYNPIEQNIDLPILDKFGWFTKFLLQFTGVPFPEIGKVARLGEAGLKPAKYSEVQSFSGANMAFRRRIVEQIIPDDLLAQADRRQSMGEDKIISMLALQYGKLIFLPDVCLQHPPNDSTYFQDTQSFTAKVIYSRLYLSRIYAHVFNQPYWKEVIIYYWYVLWRALIAILSYLIQPSKGRKDKLKGTFDGLWLSLHFSYKSSRLMPGLDWQTSITKDLEKARQALK